MRRLIASLFALCLATPLFAGSDDLRAMMTGDDSKGWEAVGRLDIAGRAFCTGSLIAENLVLTAAHCLFDADTGESYDPTTIEFLAGWRNGRAAAYRAVRRAVVHPDYDYASDDKADRVAADLALLELDQPVRKSRVTPFDVTSWPRKGAEVGVVSYAHDRAESPSIQETCKVLARQQGTLITNCNVDRGSSGAPIFAIEKGEVRIVSVVSAKAHVGDLDVALGTSLGDALDGLIAELAATNGLFRQVTPTSGALNRVERDGAAGSAKFVRIGQ